jgi:hypothetical protein
MIIFVIERLNQKNRNLYGYHNRMAVTRGHATISGFQTWAQHLRNTMYIACILRPAQSQKVGVDWTMYLIFLPLLSKCNFFILILLKKFTNRPLRKLILYLDPDKDARFDEDIVSLKGIRLLDAHCVYVDVGTSR